MPHIKDTRQRKDLTPKERELLDAWKALRVHHGTQPKFSQSPLGTTLASKKSQQRAA